VTEREVVVVEEGDRPVAIDPATISHSLLLAEAEKTDTGGKDPTEMVDELQALLNPGYWSAVAGLGDPGMIEGKRLLALVEQAISPETLMATIAKLEIPDDSSVFLRFCTVSLDGGKTPQDVATALVFKEEGPRIVIAEQEPVLRGHTD